MIFVESAMKLYLISALILLNYFVGLRAEEIEVRWEIVNLEGNAKTKAFSAKTLLPNGAKAKVKVVELKKESHIYFMDPYPVNGIPKISTVSNVGDRINCLIDKEGKLTIVSPLANAIEVDGKRLTFSNGLIIDVVVDD